MAMLVTVWRRFSGESLGGRGGERGARKIIWEVGKAGRIHVQYYVLWL